MIARVIVGTLMFAHGLDNGPSGFGDFLDSEGVPLGGLMGWGVTLLELVGGPLLIVGLLARPIAVALAVELVFAIVIVTGSNGLIGDEGVGYERDLAYIGGFLVVALLGPGRPSLDRALGLETGRPTLTTAPSDTSGSSTAMSGRPAPEDRSGV